MNYWFKRVMAVMNIDGLIVINPLKGKSGFSWFFEQSVYDPRGLARALKSEQGSGNIPKVICYEKK